VAEGGRIKPLAAFCYLLQIAANLLILRAATATNQKVGSSSPPGRTICHPCVRPLTLKMALSCGDQASVATGFTVVLPASKADFGILEALRQMVRGFDPHRHYQIHCCLLSHARGERYPLPT
jgi:hypothetical protein